jgi:hypothetical protein
MIYDQATSSWKTDPMHIRTRPSGPKDMEKQHHAYEWPDSSPPNNTRDSLFETPGTEITPTTTCASPSASQTRGRYTRVCGLRASVCHVIDIHVSNPPLPTGKKRWLQSSLLGVGTMAWFLSNVLLLSVMTGHVSGDHSPLAIVLSPLPLYLILSCNRPLLRLLLRSPEVWILVVHIFVLVLCWGDMFGWSVSALCICSCGILTGLASCTGDAWGPSVRPYRFAWFVSNGAFAIVYSVLVVYGLLSGIEYDRLVTPPVSSAWAIPVASIRVSSLSVMREYTMVLFYGKNLIRLYRDPACLVTVYYRLVAHFDST